ncbi:hypothetical protein ABZ639_16855 [Saccharomonospora sp. NPDC006951]
MDFVYDALVVLHLLGMAGIVAGLVVRASAPTGPGTKVMLYSAGAQVLTGVALVGLASSGVAGNEPDNTKVAVKLVIAMIILVLALIMHRKPQSGKGLFAATAVLTVANVAIAVFW